jgi:pimeloyl-ACP methyl ester carboxylesterase
VSRLSIGDGVEVEHAVAGEGEPLLLIMGTGGSMPLWGPVMEPLAERHRVIAYDHRGLGGSPQSEGEVSTGSLADDAAAVLDALEIERAHVIGWSLGSAVSQELAINHPDRVASLVLYCTWGKPDGFMRAIVTAMRVAWEQGTPDERMTATGMCFSPEGLDSPDFDRLFEEFSQGFPQTEEQRQTMVAQLDADYAHDTLDRLGQISAPTLVLAGEQDVFTAARLGEAVADRIPDAKFVLFEGPGSAHAMHLERTEEWLGHVLAHLGSVSAADRSTERSPG